MGNAAGFVITGTTNDLRKGFRDETNTLKGYFMVRPAKTWIRVESGGENGVYQTQVMQ
jgi:hypothetical protein